MPALALYPHGLWQIDGRDVIVTGEFVGGRTTGYYYYFEDSPAMRRWITTEGARIRARMRSEANAKQIPEASSNDAGRSPQSEVRQEDGHPKESGEGIRPGRQVAQEVDSSGWDAA